MQRSTPPRQHDQAGELGDVTPAPCCTDESTASTPSFARLPQLFSAPAARKGLSDAKAPSGPTPGIAAAARGESVSSGAASAPLTTAPREGRRPTPAPLTGCGTPRSCSAGSFLGADRRLPAASKARDDSSTPRDALRSRPAGADRGESTMKDAPSTSEALLSTTPTPSPRPITTRRADDRSCTCDGWRGPRRPERSAPPPPSLGGTEGVNSVRKRGRCRKNSSRVAVGAMPSAPPASSESSSRAEAPARRGLTRVTPSAAPGKVAAALLPPAARQPSPSHSSNSAVPDDSPTAAPTARRLVASTKSTPSKVR